MNMVLCVFCGHGTMGVRFDRRQRPYLSCFACGTRIFTRGGMLALLGYISCVEAMRGLGFTWEQVRPIIHARFEALRTQGTSVLKEVLDGAGRELVGTAG